MKVLVPFLNVSQHVEFYLMKKETSHISIQNLKLHVLEKEDDLKQTHKCTQWDNFCHDGSP